MELQDHPFETCFRSLAEYRNSLRENEASDRRRREIEASLEQGEGQRFEIEGFCSVCECERRFVVEWSYSYRDASGRLIPNWREHQLCSGCRMNARMRAAVHFLRLRLKSSPRGSLYLTEQLTPVFGALATRRTDVVGSEFLGAGRRGGEHNEKGIRHEDLTALSFADERFDVVGSFDVLEHVPDHEQGLREVLRVLRPGGHFVLTVPFLLESHSTEVLARVVDGETVHLSPPEYHYDPIQEGGCLSFYRFGWELLEQMRTVGFSDARLYPYWSERLGYLGPHQMVIEAVR